MNRQPQWRTASRSGIKNNCVQVATNLVDVALVRDSKLGSRSPVLSVSPRVFGRFLTAVRAGRFDP